MQFRQDIFKVFLVLRKNREVIGIAEIIFHFELLLKIHIELMHIDVHQKLGGQIAKRKTDAVVGRMETRYNFANELTDIRIDNMAFKNFNQHSMVYVGEEFLDITLEYVTSAGMVLRYLASKIPEAIKCSMCPFVLATGIRVENKALVKISIELFINKMMQYPIAYRCLMNVPRLGIRNIKCRIRIVRICFIFQVHIKARYISPEFSLKFYDILFTAFAA